MKISNSVFKSLGIQNLLGYPVVFFETFFNLVNQVYLTIFSADICYDETLVKYLGKQHNNAQLSLKVLLSTTTPYFLEYYIFYHITTL